jgi:hypothetical protein
MPISKNDLRKSLQRFVEVVVEEADQNEVFAEKLMDVLDMSGRASQKGVAKKPKSAELPGDPLAIFQGEGARGLMSWLEGLDLEQLRRIVRQHKLDSTRNSDKWKSRDKFIDLIMERLPERMRQGNSFKNYGDRLPASNPIEDFHSLPDEVREAK